MLRRSLIAAALAASALLPSPEASAQSFTFRLHSFSSPTALDHTMHLDRWAEAVGRDSGGRIRVELYPALQLGGQARDLVQQLEDGVVDIIWTVPGFTPGRFPGTEGLELPFVNTGTSATMSPAAMEFAEKHLAATEYRGIKIISIHSTDRSVLHTTRKPVRTLEDFRGLRIRVAGRFIGEAMTAFGATPVGIPLPGVYEALARGQVDGMMINWAITAPYRFHEVAKFHTDSAVFQGMLLTLMNGRSYDRLPADLKAVIDRNSGIDYARKMGEIWDSQTPSAIAANRDAPGNEIITIDDAERARWIAAAQPVHQSWIREMNRLSRPGQQMYDDLMAITAKHGRR
ncbi:TRAP transporter substrate-binding protein [Elioraea rosea]|uniref:TRAP transporter substrate-binding protein n=1 Tax=Elioraea rosea TaxID=2492390 RepID=UPI001183F571|nr:TRAP transporter substrate-binding protein [Elioraea rosea]